MPAPEMVFMFSGQGSQYYQMGRRLYELNTTFREWMLRLDHFGRHLSGHSVVANLYSDACRGRDAFDRTLLTHPAIFMVEYSLAQALIQEGVLPDLVLGVSMGSFAAAAVAGLIAVEDALAAVMQQAVALEQHCERGGMTAILSDPQLFEADFLCRHSELAAINFSSHFVVSARQKELAQIEAVLTNRDVSFQRLPVSVAFHSHWMDDAKAPFESFMLSINARPGRVPLVCCEQIAVLSELPRNYFWNVVRNPIRFNDTVKMLEQERSRRYIDVGPAGTLATFLKYGMPAGSQSTVHSIMTPFGLDQDNLDALSEAVRH